MDNNTTTKTREALDNDVGKLKEDAVHVVQDVRNHAHAHVDETRQRVNDTIVTIRETFASHPLALLGVGFAFGFLFALRFNR
jgi:ElaB/YqjD/DUF883 family membrane-anchored ribosome-binding protein